MEEELHFYGKGPDRPWVNSRLTNAGIVGHTTASTARLWVRVWKPGAYALVVSDREIPAGLSTSRPRLIGEGAAARAAIVSRDGAEQPIQRALLFRQEFSGDTDCTGVFDLAGLQPETKYWYAVFPIDAEPSRNPWDLPPAADCRFFRTQKAQSDALVFGLISCHMPYAQNGDVVNMQMWDRLYDTLDESGADFLIAGGDQVYVDGNDAVSIWAWLKSVHLKMLALSPEERMHAMRSWYRDIYRGYWGFPALTRTFGRFPTYMMWDDHEIMDGWGSYTDKELATELLRWWEMADADKGRALAREMFQAATETYREYEHSHNPPTAPGAFDYSYALHGCAFYVLDMRGQRDFNRPGDERILGAAQMQRFLEWLRSAEVTAARAVFVVSPVPVVHAANFVVNKFDLAFLGLADDLRDEWEHESNWGERNRILREVFRLSHEQGKTVAFLSGDVHIGAAFRIRHQAWSKANVYQLTSSAITYPAPAALELVIREAGELGDHEDVPERERYTYNKLDSLPTNNFGIVRVTAEGGETCVTWDLYGRTSDGKNLVKHKRIEL
jgi:alkaline phosphatase D